MQWIYDGPSKAVTFPNGVTAKRGEPVEVPDDAVLGADWLPADLPFEGPFERPDDAHPGVQLADDGRPMADQSLKALRRYAAERLDGDYSRATKKTLLSALAPQYSPPDEGNDKEA